MVNQKNINMKLKYKINLSNLFAKVEMEKGEIWMDNNYQIHEVLKNGRTHEQGGELALVDNLFGFLSVNMVLSNSKRKDLLSQDLLIDNKTYSDKFREVVNKNNKDINIINKKINLSSIRLFDVISQNTVEQNFSQKENILTSEETFLELFNDQENKKLENNLNENMKYGGKYKYEDGGKLDLLKLRISNKQDKKDWLDLWSSFIGKDLNKVLFNEAEKEVIDIMKDYTHEYEGLNKYWSDKGYDYVKLLTDQDYGLVHSSTLLPDSLYVKAGKVLTLLSINSKYNINSNIKLEKLNNINIGRKEGFDFIGLTDKINRLNQVLGQLIKRFLLTNSDLALIELGFASALVRDPEYYNLSESKYVNLKRQNVNPQIEKLNQDYLSAIKSLLNNGIGYSNKATIFSKKVQANNELLGQLQNINNQIDNQEELTNTDIYNKQSLSNQQVRNIFNESVQKSKANQTSQLLELNDSLSVLKKQNQLFNNNFELTQRLFLNFNYKGQFTNDLYLILYNQFISQGYSEQDANNMALSRLKTIEDSKGNVTTHRSYTLSIQERAKNEKAKRLLSNIFSK